MLNFIKTIVLGALFVGLLASTSANAAEVKVVKQTTVHTGTVAAKPVVQQTRFDRRHDRRFNRHERRFDRRHNRFERRHDRREHRYDRRHGRQELRQDRRDNRNW